MNAASKIAATDAPDYAAFPNWPARFIFYRDLGVREWLIGCLHSIRDEAETAADRDWRMAAQGALDTGDLTEIEYLIEQGARDEAEADRAYRFECRYRREWNPLTMTMGGLV